MLHGAGILRTARVVETARATGTRVADAAGGVLLVDSGSGKAAAVEHAAVCSVSAGETSLFVVSPSAEATDRIFQDCPRLLASATRLPFESLDEEGRSELARRLTQAHPVRDPEHNGKQYVARALDEAVRNCANASQVESAVRLVRIELNGADPVITLK